MKKYSIQASLSNQTNEINNMMASLFQMNFASTSGLGSLPSNTVANPKGELKVITTRSGLVLDGPTVPTPLPFINPEEDERVEETLTDPNLSEYTIKVPPPPVQKYKPPNTITNPKGELNAITTRSGIVLDGPSVPIPPPFINPEEDERIEETLTDQDLAEYTIKVPPPLLHINITLADALILIPKYQKMFKALLSNKEKLLELANTPLNENCSAVILKKLPEKLGYPGKFLIPCGFIKVGEDSYSDAFFIIFYYIQHTTTYLPFTNMTTSTNLTTTKVFSTFTGMTVIIFVGLVELMDYSGGDQVQGQRFRTRLIKIQVAQKKVKIAFENADSNSRVELIPSKIKYVNKVVLNFHKEFLAFSSFKRKGMTDYFRITCSSIRKKS
nr:hypothetical protein [Tanacetum cinerariifolium]